MKKFKVNDVEIICEFNLNDDVTFLGNKVVYIIEKFTKISYVNIANRYYNIFDYAKGKVYTKDCLIDIK